MNGTTHELVCHQLNAYDHLTKRKLINILMKFSTVMVVTNLLNKEHNIHPPQETKRTNNSRKMDS